MVAIGKFDGVHRGHQQLLVRTLAEARRHVLQPGVVTFDVHPGEVLHRRQHRYLTLQANGCLACRRQDGVRRPAPQHSRAVRDATRGIRRRTRCGDRLQNDRSRGQLPLRQGRHRHARHAAQHECSARHTRRDPGPAPGQRNGRVFNAHPPRIGRGPRDGCRGTTRSAALGQRHPAGGGTGILDDHVPAEQALPVAGAYEGELGLRDHDGQWTRRPVVVSTPSAGTRLTLDRLTDLPSVEPPPPCDSHSPLPTCSATRVAERSFSRVEVNGQVGRPCAARRAAVSSLARAWRCDQLADDPSDPCGPLPRRTELPVRTKDRTGSGAAGAVRGARARRATGRASSPPEGRAVAEGAAAPRWPRWSAQRPVAGVRCSWREACAPLQRPPGRCPTSGAWVDPRSRPPRWARARVRRAHPLSAGGFSSGATWPAHHLRRVGPRARSVVRVRGSRTDENRRRRMARLPRGRGIHPGRRRQRRIGRNSNRVSGSGDARLTWKPCSPSSRPRPRRAPGRAPRSRGTHRRRPAPASQGDHRALAGDGRPIRPGRVAVELDRALATSRARRG